MSKKLRYVLVGIGLLFILGIPISHLVGQMIGANTQNEMLLSIFCKDKQRFKADLTLLPLPPTGSKYAILPVENQAELWEAVKAGVFARCENLQLYPD